MQLGIGLGLGFQSGARGQVQQVTKYLFIDGGCLSARIKQFSEKYCEGNEIGIYWPSLGSSYRKTFYYDAFPVRRDDESDELYESRVAPIRQRHDVIAAVDGFRVYEGDARHRRRRGQEQKKVDVMIAVDMLTHTFRRNMDEAALVASDVDFKPLLDALVDGGMFVHLFYTPGETSRELLRAADRRTPISDRQVKNWLDQETNARYPLPELSGNNVRPQFFNARKVWEENSERNGEISLWYDNTYYFLVWGNSPQFMQFTCSNLHNLRICADEEHSIIIPDQL